MTNKIKKTRGKPMETLLVLMLMLVLCARPVLAEQAVPMEMEETVVSEETVLPLPEPTDAPLPEAADTPVQEPADTSISEPVDTPIPQPTDIPTPQPTDILTPQPTAAPVSEPTAIPLPEAKGDFSMKVYTGSHILKAGSLVSYEVELVNTGELPLKEIALDSRFSCPKIEQEWEEAEGLRSGSGQEGGPQAVLCELNPGERRVLYLDAQLTEEQSGTLSHTITADAVFPGEEPEALRREAKQEYRVEPLKVDYTVEKTADCANALPGDRITYWICIRNTGERTLHSVVSTERFLGADIQAQFVEQEGVILNGAKTQAMISEISPGQAVSLKAIVVVPQEAAGQELLNQVTVTTAETGVETVSAQAAVTVQSPAEIPEEPEAETYENGAVPKTGDDTLARSFTVTAAVSFFAAAGVFVLGKAKRKH